MANEAKAAAGSGVDDVSVPPPPPVETVESTGPSRSTSKRPSVSSTGSASIVKDALKPNLSAVDATSQLKVLCRKFAALTEKVKDETKAREDAEREVRRLKAIVEGNDTPVVASYRMESHAYIRELKDAQETLKQELKDEKAKNAMLVSKALELEKEKSALLTAAASSSAAQMWSKDVQSANYDHAGPYTSRHTNEWDREQVVKIQETLRMTIDELQDELTRKEEELGSCRERLQRERARVKALEVDLQEREQASQDEQRVLKELEFSMQEQRDQFEAIEKEMQASQHRLDEEATIRSTLEQQIETLNDVNAALEQRAKALVRRLELSQSLVDEMEELKLQVRDTEVDKETLVLSIKDLKEQHYLKETQWKAQLEQLRSEKLVLAAQISDLQNEITSLRTQNSLFSEWMLVRSENIAAAQQQQQRKEEVALSEAQLEVHHRQSARQDHRHPRRPERDSDHYPSSSRARVRPLATSDLDDSVYAHSSVRCPLSPSKTRSMTTASPIKQKAPSWLTGTRRTSMSSSSGSSSDGSERSSQRESEAVECRQASRTPGAFSKPIPNTTIKSATRAAATNNTTVRSKLSDHERLRELMSRNRELQTRLQQETLATRNLEQEITHITSQRGYSNSSRGESN